MLGNELAKYSRATRVDSLYGLKQLKLHFIWNSPSFSHSSYPDHRYVARAFSFSFGNNNQETTVNPTDVSPEMVILSQESPTVQRFVSIPYNSVSNDVVINVCDTSVTQELSPNISNLESAYNKIGQQLEGFQQLLQSVVISHTHTHLEHACSSIPDLQLIVDNLLQNANLPGLSISTSTSTSFSMETRAANPALQTSKMDLQLRFHGNGCTCGCGNR